MIATRFLKRIKQQDWTGVVIEILIVIVGVFIGLQVSNWNQARTDKSLETQYLKRLRTDFQRSIKGAEDNISAMDIQYDLEGDMLHDLATCQLDPGQRNRFASGIYLIGKFGPPPLISSTMDELRSTGRLGLITDMKLRQDLAEVSQRAQTYGGILKMITARAAPLVDYIYQRAVFKQPKDGFLYQDALKDGVPPGSVTFDFPALCKDSRYAGSISALQMFTRTITLHNKMELKGYKAMLRAIHADLDKAK